MCKPKVPKVDTAALAPTPAPPEQSATVAQADPIVREDAAARARRKGRNGLKIDLALGGSKGGSGLNIPVG